ncbi:PD-(D/E)XK nuclease-like domain-containing protein [Acinetobacter higginsii]|uniref:PD-(D/E)XK nuclease-like domain-containing protein n=1 Tax=Acinetobacter higginsii TaxID=70347 RepID=UPI001F4A1CD4|nr:PD-(D/E)XK nuclease-like domain-containing protein [Acinetobacter higginsii]MCH7380343.1 PD-(D/E)XK nuclease-like domain-containing protein [Acinetobacter higginsii]
MKLFRCSSLHKLIGDGRSKAAVISDTAKSAIRDIVKEDLYGFRSFTGNQYTQKGNLLEDLAIEMSGKMRFRNYQKHVGRVENELITGECDVLDLERKLIIDTKVTWDIGTHPFFQDEAVEKVKKAGYDVQMQAYMWLYDCEVAEVDFWLFPCPPELLKDWDDIDQLVHLVEAIDIRERKTTVTIERDESVIQKIKDKIPHCQNYYEQLFAERGKGKVAA